jgi:hypothetical protein
MMYREIIAVSSDIITKHINALCKTDTNYMPIESGPIQSDHWAMQRNTHHADIHPLDLRPVPPDVPVSLDVPSPLFVYTKGICIYLSKSQHILGFVVFI